MSGLICFNRSTQAGFVFVFGKIRNLVTRIVQNAAIGNKTMSESNREKNVLKKKRIGIGFNQYKRGYDSVELSVAVLFHTVQDTGDPVY